MLQSLTSQKSISDSFIICVYREAVLLSKQLIPTCFNSWSECFSFSGKSEKHVYLVISSMLWYTSINSKYIYAHGGHVKQLRAQKSPPPAPLSGQIMFLYIFYIYFLFLFCEINAGRQYFVRNYYYFHVCFQNVRTLSLSSYNASSMVLFIDLACCFFKFLKPTHEDLESA